MIHHCRANKGVTKIYGKTPREMGIFWSLKNLFAPPIQIFGKSFGPPIFDGYKIVLPPLFFILKKVLAPPFTNSLQNCQAPHFYQTGQKIILPPLPSFKFLKRALLNW